MKYLKPKTLSDYPLYIFFYWVTLWGLSVVLSLIGIYLSSTDDHKYIQIFDKSYYFIPIGEEVREMVVKTGIIIGAVTLLAGYSWMFYAWARRKKIRKRKNP